MDLLLNYTEQFIKQGKFSQNDIFIKDNLLLETILGSHAYGCAGETSDYDISAIFMDRHQDLYPQQYGHILGFNNLSRFESKEIKGAGKRIVLDNGRECEGEWHSLTNFFFLTGVKGSPPLVETLFTRRNWVTVGSDIGWMLRDNRKLFLSARTFQSFKGYSFGQLSRIRNGHVSGKSDNSTRQVYIDKFGYDSKMAYHLLRLLDEIEQILTIQDIDLMRAKDACIAMRKGEWGTFEQLEAYFNQKLATLEEIMLKGTLPLQPQVGALQKLLAECIEQYYGSMSKANVEYVSAKDVMEKLSAIEQKLDTRSAVKNIKDMDAALQEKNYDEKILG